MNFPLPMLALLVAQRQGDSANDAGRIALLAMLIKPPRLGLLMALALSKQAAPKPAALPQPGKPGDTVIDTVIPKPQPQSFFPTFVGFTKKQAAARARELGLEPVFIELEHNSPGKDTVKTQEPLPGANWPHDLKEVKLYVS